MNVQPVREGDRGAFLHVVAQMVGPDMALQLVGRRHHDDVAPGRGLGHRHHLEAGFLGLGRAGRSLAQRDPDLLDAAVPQVGGMCMSLAAVTDDHDLLGLDQVHIGVTIVINAHGFLSCCPVVSDSVNSRIGGFYSAFAPRAMPTTPLRAISVLPSERISSMKASDFLGLAGQREDEGFDRRIGHRRVEDIGDPQRFAPFRAARHHLDQGDLALQMFAVGGQVVDLMDRDQLVHLRLDLLDDHRGAGGHDRHPRHGFIDRDRRDGQAFDIVAAAGKQAHHAGQHAGFVVHQDGDRMSFYFTHCPYA